MSKSKSSPEPQRSFKASEWDVLLGVLRSKPVSQGESLEHVERRMRERLAEYRDVKHVNAISHAAVIEIIKALGQEVPTR